MATHDRVQLILGGPELGTRRGRALSLVVDEQTVAALDERVQDLAHAEAALDIRPGRARVEYGHSRLAPALTSERNRCAAQRYGWRQLAGVEVAV